MNTGVRKKMTSKGAGQPGSYLANMQRLADTGAKARASSHERLRNLEAQIANQQAQMNLGVDKTNIDLAGREQLFKQQAEAAKRNQLMTGVGQVAELARSQEMDDLAQAYNRQFSDKYSFEYLRPWEKEGTKES